MRFPPPRWAVWCAWLVPFTILPSAAWRVSLLFHDGDPFGEFVRGGWYLVLLSVLSLGLGFLTVGLVRPWGEVFPRWLPFVSGQHVPWRVVTTAALTGGCLLILLMLYGTWNALFGNLFDFAPVVRYGEETFTNPGPLVEALYAPMVAWGPLLIAVAIDYRRRRYDARAWAVMGNDDEIRGTGAAADRRP